MIMAEVIVRREPTAEASFADIRARIRFGIAIAAIVRMIDTAISNSISEKPFALRNLHLSMTDRHFDPQLSCAGILGAIRREQAITLASVHFGEAMGKPMPSKAVALRIPWGIMALNY